MPNLLEEAWADGLAYVLETTRPAGGISKHGNAMHAWLRLPLYDQAEQLTTILCHDELVMGGIITNISSEMSLPIHRLGVRVAA